MEAKTKKIVIISALSVGLLTGLYFILKPSKTTNNQEGGGIIDPTGNGDIKNPDVQFFSARKTADRLLELMSTTGAASFLNPSERDEIFRTLTGISQQQFKEVVIAFGHRKYNTIFNNDSDPFANVKYHPLPFWLKSELTDEDYQTLRNKYPQSL